MQPNLNGSVETMEIVSGASSQQAAGIQPSQSARIEVIGVGGGGSNAVNRMILSDLEGVAYRVLNTDAQALIQSQAQTRLQLGQTLTRGLGAGGNPTIGQQAAEGRCVVQGRVERPALPLSKALIQALSWVVHCLRHVT